MLFQAFNLLFAVFALRVLGLPVPHPDFLLGSQTKSGTLKSLGVLGAARFKPGCPNGLLDYLGHGMRILCLTHSRAPMVFIGVRANGRRPASFRLQKSRLPASRITRNITSRVMPGCCVHLGLPITAGPLPPVYCKWMRFGTWGNTPLFLTNIRWITHCPICPLGESVRRSRVPHT